jgi:predicted DNA binding CopG/RHH family protein
MSARWSSRGGGSAHKAAKETKPDQVSSRHDRVISLFQANPEGRWRFVGLSTKIVREERKFWATHDATDYFDQSKAQRGVFPNLKPSTTSISLRMSIQMLERLKIAANRRDIPYQSLIKVWLDEKLKQSA